MRRDSVSDVAPAAVQYVGEWSDGKINGYGKLFYVDGARRPAAPAAAAPRQPPPPAPLPPAP